MSGDVRHYFVGVGRTCARCDRARNAAVHLTPPTPEESLERRRGRRRRRSAALKGGALFGRGGGGGAAALSPVQRAALGEFVPEPRACSRR